MTEATLDPKGLEAAAKGLWRAVHPKENPWSAQMDALKDVYRSHARATVLAYLAAIENPAPVEED